MSARRSATTGRPRSTRPPRSWSWRLQIPQPPSQRWEPAWKAPESGDNAAAELVRDRQLPKDAAAHLADDPLWTDAVSVLRTTSDRGLCQGGSAPRHRRVHHVLRGSAGRDHTAVPGRSGQRRGAVLAQSSRLIASVADDTRLDLDIVPMIGADDCGSPGVGSGPAGDLGGRRAQLCLHLPAATSDHDRVRRHPHRQLPRSLAAAAWPVSPSWRCDQTARH